MAWHRYPWRYQPYYVPKTQIRLLSNISIGNNCVLHTAATSPTGLGAELLMNGDTVVQNNCTLYSCTVERQVYIGHNSVIMEGAILQKGCIIAPNSVVPPGRVVKERQVWGGNPIKYIRKALEQEAFVTLDYSRHVNTKTHAYLSAFLPYNNAYLYRHGPVEVTPTNPAYRQIHHSRSVRTTLQRQNLLPRPKHTQSLLISYQNILHYTLVSL